MAQRLILFKTNELITNDYLYYFLISKPGFSEHESRQTGTTVFGVSSDSIKGSSFIVPPVNEQDEITSYLKYKVDKIDRALPKLTQALQLLKERRTALISAAAAGKIDVRSVA